MAKKKANSGVLSHRVTVRSYQLIIFLLLFGGIGVYSVLFSFADSANKGGGKPPRGTTSSLSYTVTVDNNNDGLPNWGDTIRFNPVTTATTQPHVELLCSQNGTVVYSAIAGYFDSYPWPWTQNFLLGSSSLWSSGAADCTARMYMFSGKGTTTLATIAFHVNA